MGEMTIALGLGIPLMIYGFAGGDMSVNSNLARVAWLLVGLLTLAVMVFSGKHFFVGAWQSFKNHSANMDTLVALGTGTAWLYSMIVVFMPNGSARNARPNVRTKRLMVRGRFPVQPCRLCRSTR